MGFYLEKTDKCRSFYTEVGKKDILLKSCICKEVDGKEFLENRICIVNYGHYETAILVINEAHLQLLDGVFIVFKNPIPKE